MTISRDGTSQLLNVLPALRLMSRYCRTNEMNHCSRLSLVPTILATSFTMLAKTRLEILKSKSDIWERRSRGYIRLFPLPIFQKVVPCPDIQHLLRRAASQQHLGACATNGKLSTRWIHIFQPKLTFQIASHSWQQEESFRIAASTAAAAISWQILLAALCLTVWGKAFLFTGFAVDNWTKTLKVCSHLVPILM